ncbi:MAG: hypothetical protein DRP00_02720 [Candidatus Aenigmatarchaeota archaeon]|nr:MAG: hypothetical protein DRP00_02720 [Candidatus Aenigmarchaeota archaeon]
MEASHFILCSTIFLNTFFFLFTFDNFIKKFSLGERDLTLFVISFLFLLLLFLTVGFFIGRTQRYYYL